MSFFAAAFVGYQLRCAPSRPTPHAFPLAPPPRTPNRTPPSHTRVAHLRGCRARGRSTRYGFRSLPAAVERCYGTVALLCFSLALLYRLWNEAPPSIVLPISMHLEQW